MKTEDPIQLIVSQCCHQRLWGHFTDLDRKIGEAIATLNAIGSLLDLAK